LEQLTAWQPYGIDVSWDVLSRKVVEGCHQKGILAFADAMGAHEKVEDYRQAMVLGVDVIQTDHPIRVLRAIEMMMMQKK
jgi:glycerophosphoryl diester phosphodiesterase